MSRLARSMKSVVSSRDEVGPPFGRNHASTNKGTQKLHEASARIEWGHRFIMNLVKSEEVR
jgi:hypothetical protein